MNRLTDEEIVKELINESNRGEWCELSFIDCVEVRVLKNAIDLIHRQKAEIERLTEEKSDILFDFKDRVASAEQENAELQKQVDELNKLSDGYFTKAYFYYQKCKAYGIENFYDDELEPKPDEGGETITFPKWESEVE